jgi:hypothetical protein
VAVVGAFAAEAWLTDWRAGVPLDDAFIHLRIADNLASGRGFGFNPGEPLPATTSPLWVLLLALPAVLGANLVAAAKVLSAISLLAVSVGTARLGWRLTRRNDVALLAGLGAVLSGRLVWAAASAMETLAFTAFALFALERAMAREEGASRRTDIGLGLLFGASALLRPEGFLLFALWLAWEALRLRPLRLRLPPPWVIASFATAAIPWLAFCLATTGSPFPTTFAAKRAFLEPDPAWLFLARHVVEVFEGSPLLCLGWPLGIALALRTFAGRGFGLALAWSLALPAAAAILLPVQYHHGRYLMPVLPVELVFGATGVAWVLERFPRMEARKPLFRIAIVLLVAGGGYGAFRFALALGANVAEVNQLHVRMGLWVRQAVPENDLVAACDIGAVGYLGNRRVLDLAGIATPEVAPLLRGRRLGGGQDEALFPIVARERPSLLIVYPDWYPHLTARPDLFEPAALVKSETQTIAGGRLLVAYRARWDRFTPAPPMSLSDAAAEIDLARARLREGRGDAAWGRLVEIEARGPLDRGWRRRFYVLRAEVALARGDCNAARQSLLRLDWLSPPPSFRRREGVDALEERARACRTP